MIKSKITLKKNTYIWCSKKNSPLSKEQTRFVSKIKTKNKKYVYLHCSNNNPIPNRSIITWPPGIQSSIERKQNKDDIAKLSSHHLEGE